MQRSSLALSTCAALCMGPFALAQNDDCTGAIPIALGVNGPYTNVGSTTSTPAFTCVTGGHDIWFSYVAECTGHRVSMCGADYDSCIEVYDGTGGCGALVSVACNDDSCFRQSEAAWAATPGTTYYIRAGGWDDLVTGGDTGNFNLVLTCDLGVTIVGAAEPAAGPGNLAARDTSFVDNDFLKWNYRDPNSLYSSQFAVTALNFGPSPTGVTLQLPGLMQRWAGSTPPGQEIILPPNMVGGGDHTFQVLPGLFTHGLSMRLQGLVLDTVNNPGAFPVVCTSNTIEFHNLSCGIYEGFDGLANGVGIFPTGWSDGGGIRQWSCDSNGTPSGGTGPIAGYSEANYMYCEASSPASLGNTYIMNTAVYPSAGLSTLGFQLSRNGEDIGTLEVRMGDGTGTFPTLLATYTGPGLHSPDYWTRESLPLGGPLPANVQFQFHYTHGGTFYGDVAIDDFCLR